MYGRILSLDLPHSRNLLHGFHTPTKMISIVLHYFKTMPCCLDKNTGQTQSGALPSQDDCLIVAGVAAHSHLINYECICQIASKVGAYVLADMTYISGLVAGGVIPSPFPWADVVTTMRHKLLHNPWGAMIFYQKGQNGVLAKGKPIMHDLKERINFAVFPGLQDGQHNTPSMLSAALRQASMPEFVG
jgi:glycine hydroxymethyltransferase